jgi:short-subunit dehydrogenase
MSRALKEYGPWALVAGASEGLGAAFATLLARSGLNLVLLARRQAELEALAAKLRAEHRVEAVAGVVDLAAADLRERVKPLLEGKEIGLLIHNAAFSPLGELVEQPVADSLRALDVNCRSSLELLHLLVPPMAQRGRGAVVLMSSLTAFQGSPFTSVYGATKAFELTLAEGLWAELKPRGVDVLACCAGATRTPGYLRAMPNGAPGELEPTQVAEEALAALGKRPLHIPGRFNRFASLLMRKLMTRQQTISMMAAQTKKLKAASP